MIKRKHGAPDLFPHFQPMPLTDVYGRVCFSTPATFPPTTPAARLKVWRRLPLQSRNDRESEEDRFLPHLIRPLTVIHFRTNGGRQVISSLASIVFLVRGAFLCVRRRTQFPRLLRDQLAPPSTEVVGNEVLHLSHPSSALGLSVKRPRSSLQLE